MKFRTESTYRLGDQGYFDCEFSNMLIETALTTQGRLKEIRNKLATNFAKVRRSRPGLFLQKSDFIYDVLRSPIDSQSVADIRKRSIRTATIRGKFTLVSHDGEYKCAKSSILSSPPTSGGGGRARMVVRTLSERSGGIPGTSIETGEGGTSRRSAVGPTLPAISRTTCLFLFAGDVSRFYPPPEGSRGVN